MMYGFRVMEVQVLFGILNLIDNHLVTWTQSALPNASTSMWSPRFAHATAVFAGAVWLQGGISNPTGSDRGFSVSKDLWKSSSPESIIYLLFPSSYAYLV